MILRRRYIIWILLGLVAGVLNQQVIPVVSGTDDNTVGYTLQSSPEGIEVYALTQNGFDASPLIVMEGFTIDGQDAALWNIPNLNAIALSLDRQRIAFFASQDNTNASLFTLDLASLTIQQTQVAFNSISTLSVLKWSQDSRYLYAYAVPVRIGIAGMMFPIIYDVVQDTIIYTFDDLVFSIEWLPDSRGLIFQRGRSIHQFDIHTLTESIVAQITPSDVRIEITTTTPDLGIEGNMVYSMLQDRIFFVYAQPLDMTSPREEIWIVSTDLNGQVRLEADINNLYSDEFQTIVWRSFFDESTNSVVLIIQQDVFGDTIIRWSIVKVVSDNNIEIIYEKNFASFTDIKVISTIRVSPDGDYLALGGNNPEDATGSVTVVDLVTGSEVWSTETSETVCSLYWSSNDRVVYGQTEGTRCPFMRDNLPASILIEHDLTTKLSSILRHEPGHLQYYISVFPEIPLYNS